MTETEKLRAAVINKIKRDYKDDVALLIGVSGHETDGDGHGECFDYFVPADSRGFSLSRAFIVDGIGHDLYPRSFERCEKTAELEDMTICLANATILYSKSKADEERFLSLQKKLFENLQNPEFRYRKALMRIESAMDIYRAMAFEDKLYKIKAASGFVNSYVTSAAAFVNGTFADTPIFTKEQAACENPKTRMYHCPKLLKLPKNFYEISEILLSSINAEELKEASRKLILYAREFMKENAPKKAEHKAPPIEELLGWYNEMSLHFRRIRYFAKMGMPCEALSDGINMQSEISLVAADFGFPDIDILSVFDKNNLSAFAKSSDAAEKAIRAFLAKSGADLAEYKNADEFAASL